jgi:molybdopterin molybdotransferase
MLELEAALAKILEVLPKPSFEEIDLGAAHGRVLAETARSSINLPVFDNSAMDGYAVRSADVAKASKDSPARLKITGKVAAGETFAGNITEGACVRLFTGSPLPHGADAVVMQEDTRPAAPESVDVFEPAKPWENTRLQGEDIKQGAVLAKAGDVLGTGAIALLAATGSRRVTVGRRPVVGLLATGSELIEPGDALSPGKIYESNRISLASLVARAGGVARIFPIVADTLEGTREALSAALAECDLLVTSGGVSVGEMDFIKPALQEIGGSLDFWKVAIKPGRPFVFGQAKGKLLFGVPGNPISALVTFLVLVWPAILRWQGATEIGLPRNPGVLSEALANSGERRHFMRVKLDHEGKVTSAGMQASHVLSSMAAANGLVDVPPNTTLSAGAAVKVLRWE